MSSTLQEVLERRQESAAKNAHRAVVRLSQGDSDDLRRQLDVEEALEDLLRYTRMSKEFDGLDLEPYGHRSKHDLLRDMNRAHGGDVVARQRLDAHRRTSDAVPSEFRDIGGSASTFATIPRWLTTSPSPTSVASSPLSAYERPLTMSTGADVRLVGFSTPPIAVAQTAANASVSPVDFVDMSVTLPLRTFVSSVMMSQQMLDQGERGIDAQVLPRMSDAVTQAIDDSVLNGDGSNGTVVGLRNVPSASTQTYTDASPDAASFIAALESLVRKVEVGRGGSPVAIMHPRRLSFLREKVGTATAPIAVTWSEPRIPGAVVTMNGTVQIIADANVPTDISTDQDAVVVLRGTEILGDFYTSPAVTLLDFNTGSGTMKVKIVVRRYAAFSAARLPAAVGIMSGTGLAAP